jgi:hypothetical protein
LTACGNDNAKTSTESAPVTPGIENTNGNIPDTSTTMRLNNPLPIDSSNLKDSVPR